MGNLKSSLMDASEVYELIAPVKPDRIIPIEDKENKNRTVFELQWDFFDNHQDIAALELNKDISLGGYLEKHNNPNFYGRRIKILKLYVVKN